MTPPRLGPPPMNPLSRMLASLLAAVALIGALFFGVFVFLTAVALGLIAWAALWLRIWWVRRRANSASDSAPPGAGAGEVIEGEYTVVSDDEQEQDGTSQL